MPIEFYGPDYTPSGFGLLSLKEAWNILAFGRRQNPHLQRLLYSVRLRGAAKNDEV